MMFSRIHHRQRQDVAVTLFDGKPSQAVHKEQWITVCAGRLHELRPHAAMPACAALAQEMWAEVASFDPYLAAEMEHESCIFDD